MSETKETREPRSPDRDRRRYGKADDELVGFFSSALGVRAQDINSDGGATDPNERHYTMLRALARGSMAWHDTVAATLALLRLEHRRVLEAVYRPHGAPTWLADALAVPWGGGNFVRLACALPRAALAAQGREPGRTVQDWLAASAKDALLRSLREDAEELRMAALAAYEPLRVARIKAAQLADRERKERREAANAAYFVELVGQKRRKERERAARRTGIAA